MMGRYSVWADGEYVDDVVGVDIDVAASELDLSELDMEPEAWAELDCEGSVLLTSADGCARWVEL